MFQFGHGGEPWSHYDLIVLRPRTDLCFNSATAVSRGVTEWPVSSWMDELAFQFGHGGEPWSHNQLWPLQATS